MTDHPAALTGFDHQPRTRLIYGVHAVERVGELARELGGRVVLLVTDPGIVAAGHAGRVRQHLKNAGLRVLLFDSVRENPTTRCVDACLELARSGPADLIVGLGGGSSMDTAKGCNFLFSNGGRMQDYWGVGKATRPMLPLIAIPTTAGTGSECQSFALIADEETHQKMACGDPKAAARVAILDPALTISQPAGVTACTGIDAIAHALESAVTRRRNPLSLLYAREAFALCFTSFARVLAEPGDLPARGRMLLGAALAGMAIENSMLGAAHSAANPLTAHFGVAHGKAVGLMLPAVISFNAHLPEAAATYALLMRQAEPGIAGNDADLVAELVRRLQGLLQKANLPVQLRGEGVTEKSLIRLAEEAAGQWTAGFNPRAVAASDFLELYRRTL